MSNVVSRRVISNSRSTVGFEQTRTIRPRWRVTRRSPLSRTLRPVESMNSVGVRSSTRPVLPRAIAASRRRLNSGAVLTWISPVTVITCVWSSTSSSSNWKSGSVNATCLAYLSAGGEVNANERFFSRHARAEGAGFEPAVRVNGLRFSRPVHSTALPPLREAERRLLRVRPDADRAGHAGPAEPAVAAGVLRQVLLVVVLGVEERRGVIDLGRDLAEAALGELGPEAHLRRLRGGPLLRRRRVDG